jgi:hypothetical protein
VTDRAVKTAKRPRGLGPRWRIAVGLLLVVPVALAVAAGLWRALRASASDGPMGVSVDLALTTGLEDARPASVQDSAPELWFLPVVMRRAPQLLSMFGTEIDHGKVAASNSRAKAAGVGWVRYNGIAWDKVEATQGTRNWGRLRQFESEVEQLSANGLTPMVILRGTPSWAQKFPDYACGPIREDALDDFADFVGEVVRRYSIPPYNVKYWEIWNEPDVIRNVPPTCPYGCWGDEQDEYYGGRYYAQMLKQVYPAIKQADPEAQVILGGLLMLCDSDDPTLHPSVGDCPSAKFLDGILVEGGASAFDIMAFHSYPYWEPSFDARDWDLTQLHWDHRGGVLLGKLDFIRQRFQEYGVRKPILMNEGGLMCASSDNNYPPCSSQEFRQAQADHLVKLYARSWANGLLGSAWYTLDGAGWRQGGLLDDNQNPRLAYSAYQFMSQLLEGASYSRSLSGSALEGYAFYSPKAQREVRFYWTNDSSTVPLSLPAGTVAVYDESGRAITPGDGAMNVGFDPIVVEVLTP